jgi:hypothetical protein
MLQRLIKSYNGFSQLIAEEIGRSKFDEWEDANHQGLGWEKRMVKQRMRKGGSV